MPARPEFKLVFKALRELLLRHAGELTISDDSERRFCLHGGSHPKHKTPLPIAWVEIGKAYVSFHHMGLYARPELLESVSKELSARIQGKSCFNFRALDPVVFAELEELTARGFDAFRKAGFMP
jgi:hypothetical protein